MAPTVNWRSGCAPRNEGVRNAILAACQAAANTADFADFSTMEIWTGRHTSRSDAANHATTRIKTVVQIGDSTHQVAHIYMDLNFGYTGHNLFPNVKND
ncbi:hypothetical protein V8C40DRAFT_243292 [Trichoderma camerunense]